MSSSSSSPILLRSSDGVLFELEEAVAMELQTISFAFEESCARTEIPLPNIHSKSLEKVIEYCKKHVSSNKNINDVINGKKNGDLKEEEDMKSWDAKYIAGVVDNGILPDLLVAANFLNVKGLLDLGCQTVADMIKGKSPEEIRQTFNIKNDFTPAEEEEIRKEHSWAFQ